MIRNFLKIALRNLQRNKLHSSINLMGLAIGLAAVMCLSILLQNEVSYDQFHKGRHQIYRVGIKAYEQGTKMSDQHVFTSDIGADMHAELAGIKDFTRFSTPKSLYLATQDKSIKIKDVLHADSSFLQMFSFPLTSGNSKEALTAPNSIVLTESTATRLFGHLNVLGETLVLNGGKSLQVSGTVVDPPSNSHIDFNALLSFSSLYQEPDTYYMGWEGGNQYITYIELEEHTKPENLEAQLPDFMWRHINEDYSTYHLKYEASLQPLSDVHLHYNDYSSSLRTKLLVLGIMAALILIIACINFINLTTAQVSRRLKEVGVRKVLGASRGLLGRQFMGEAILLVVLALCVSIMLVELALPILPQVFGKSIHATGYFDWISMGGLFLLLGAVGIGSGLYPALYLASLDTVSSLKGVRSKPGKSGFRNSLVVFQFTVSITLIIGTIVVMQQLNHISSKNLGFDKEHILVLSLDGESVQSKILTLKQELEKYPEIIKSSGCSEVPGSGFTQNGYTPEGKNDPMMLHVVDVDDDFYDVFDIQFLEGRRLSRSRSTDRQALVISESLAKQLNWEKPLGKKIRRNGQNEVVGMVKDFHFASLHQKIDPLLITASPYQDRFNYLAVKLHLGSLTSAVSSTTKAWKTVMPETPIDFWFLEDAIDQIYHSEKRMQHIFFWCSGLAIFIALLGIFGLTSFRVEARKKEVGIRKVLGATTLGIVGLISKDFMRLVLFSMLIAFPLAYFFMSKWLHGFAYRIDLEVWVFLLSGALAVILAWTTVSYQCLGAALSNPLNAIRDE